LSNYAQSIKKINLQKVLAAKELRALEAEKRALAANMTIFF
jgi:cell division protein FtsB